MPVVPFAPAPPPVATRTGEDWRDLLTGRLDAQAKIVTFYENYYDGRHPLQFATTKFKEAFGNLFGAFADNWCPIVVDVPVERLEVIGFKFGGSADDAAWNIWQRSSLDAASVTAHTEAGKVGKSYLLVDPNDGDPRITVEHASQVILAVDPGDRRRRLAALKRWEGDDGLLYCTLYLPDYIFKWQTENPVRSGSPVTWVSRMDAADGPNPLGEVPVIELENAPGLLTGGESDLKQVVQPQNAVNKLCSDLMVASEFGAFRQRVATGVELPKDPVTGQVLVDPEQVGLTAAMSRFMTFESPDAKVFDLDPTDLSNFRAAIDMFIEHIAAQTRTPPYYLQGKLVNVSGDALKVADAGLAYKCRRKILFFSDPWEEAMALALRSIKIRVDAADGQALWADPEQTSLAQQVDAAIKKRQLAVPLEVIWAELGYTPQQVKDMKRLAGLPDRPPPGATASQVPPLLDGGTDSSPTP